MGYLQIFIGLGAVAGGIGFLADPTGANIGIDAAVLGNSPFRDFLIPGLVLLFVIGIGHLIAGVVSLIPRRQAAVLAMVMGEILVVWILLQIWWIGPASWLQPLYLGLGVLELVLGLLLRQKSRQKPSHQPN